MSNYTENQLVTDKNNGWSLVFGLVGKNDTVLDIGCSSGNFGYELITRKQCTVDGVDIDKKDVGLAKKKLRQAYLLNIESDSLNDLHGKYDTILMMDVIEHLATPVPTLKRVAKLLKPGGKLVFSVPNMAHVSVRLDLLLGDLDYRKTGLLDDTHLRFYSEKTLLRILNAAGYSVNRTSSSTVTYPRQLLDLKLEQAGLTAGPQFAKMIARTKGNIYQFVGVAEPAKGRPPAAGFPENNPHEEHYAQIETAMAGQNKEIEKLKAELGLKDRHIANIEAKLHQVLSSRSYRLAEASLKPLRTLRPKAKKG